MPALLRGCSRGSKLGERNFTKGCPAELAADYAEEAILKELKRLLPNGSLPHWNGTLPPVNWTCTGHSYLERIDMWPVRYGGLEGHFAIVGGYLAACFVGTYAVLRWQMHRLD